MTNTDKIKAEKLREIFLKCSAELIGESKPEKIMNEEDGPEDCKSPWEPDVIFLHDSQDTPFDVWDEHIVIRHPFHYGFCIIIKREFAEKVLVLGGLP